MRAYLVLLVALLTACGSIGGVASSTTVLPPPPSTIKPETPVDPGLGCPQIGDFVDRGRVMRQDQPESDTAIVGLIAWELSQGCERFVIEFETTEGAPATTPPSVIVEFLETRQVIRIHLNADRTVITDQIVETDLVDRLFVVRALDTGSFVDLHLRLPAQARVRVSNSPARLIIELQAGLEDFAGQAAVSDRSVVTNPFDGAEGPTNIEVSGYARTAEGSVLIIATSGDQVVADATADVAESEETWGEFKTRIDVPSGETSIFVGEEDPSDGSLAGVTVKMLNR